MYILFSFYSSKFMPDMNKGLLPFVTAKKTSVDSKVTFRLRWI